MSPLPVPVNSDAMDTVGFRLDLLQLDLSLSREVERGKSGAAEPSYAGEAAIAAIRQFAVR